MATLYFNGAVDEDWSKISSKASMSTTFPVDNAGTILDGATINFEGFLFEFDSDNSVSSGNISVAIGSSLSDTLQNFKTALETYTVFDITNIDGSYITVQTKDPTSTQPIGWIYTSADQSFSAWSPDFSGGSLGNWWMDETFETPAYSLPTSADSAVVSTTCSINSGSEPTVVNLLVNNLDSQSSNDGFNISITVTGLATFDNVQKNGGNLSGNAEFIGIEANHSSGNVIGNATFFVGPYNYSTVTGNATFTDSQYNSVNFIGTVGGTITFSSPTPVVFNIASAQWTLDTTNWIFDSSGQNWTFTNGASNSGKLKGSATFDNSSNTTNGIVTGITGFTGMSGFNEGIVKSNSSFSSGGSNLITGMVEGDADFDGYASANLGTVAGNATFVNGSQNSIGGVIETDGTFINDAYNNGTVMGNAAFETVNTNTSGAWNNGTVGGNANFYGTGGNIGTIQGDGAFYGTGGNDGLIEGNFESTQSGAPNNGTVEGNGTFSGASNSLLGLIRGDATFSTNSTNSGTVEGNGTFDNSTNTNTGYVYGDEVTFNGSSTNAGNIGLPYNLVGVVKFNNNSSCVNGGSVFSQFTEFNDNSSIIMGVVETTGLCVFNDNSVANFFSNGVISGHITASSVIFRDNSINITGIPNASAQHGGGINGSSILGII